MNAIDPVLHVPLGLPERQIVAPLSLLFDYVQFLRQFGSDLGRVRGEFVAVDLLLTFLAFDHGPTHRTFAWIDNEIDLNTVCVLHGHLPIGTFR